VLEPLRLAMIFHMLDSAKVHAQPPAYDVELRLPEDYGSPARARDFAAKTLSRWGYCGRHDDVVLIVSELVANALMHGYGTPVLRLRAVPGPDGGQPAGIRVEVGDDSPVMPAIRGPRPAGGLGLKLVERLAAGWGATHRDGGKVVWCELAVEVDADIPEATAA
jgi:anti-sigma regulatory factor (Ser/Thr protein kinase)